MPARPAAGHHADMTIIHAKRAGPAPPDQATDRRVAYRVVADAGHMINMEQTAAVSDLLISSARERSWNR